MDRAKTEVEKKVSKLIKFIQTKNKIPKDSKRELLGLVNDLQEQCHSLYSTFHDQDSDPKTRKGKSRIASWSSDLDYYSSEDIENVVEDENDQNENENVELQSKFEALRNESETKERELTSRVKDLERELEEEIAIKRSESKELGETNKGLRSQISGLELILKETGDEISTIVNKFGNSELGLTSRIEDLKNQLRNLEKEISFLRSRNAELTGSVEIKRVQEKEHVEGLMDHIKDLNLEIESLQSQKDDFEAKLEKKDEEIEHLRGENQKLIAEFDSLQSETETKNIDEIEEHKRFVKEQDDIIERLSGKIKDQQRIIKEQKDTLDKLSDDLKETKRRSFGSTSKLNPNALERKMEELAEDFRMKMEDHIRILYRRIHVAEQIHLESTNDYSKVRDLAQENRRSRQSLNLFEANFGKIKNILETEYERSELMMEKLKEGDEQGDKVGRLVKEIDWVKIWVQEKKSEVETLAAKLECKEAQETLLKEKLAKLEKKLAEEGTKKLSLENVLNRIEKRNKELEYNAKGHEVELLSLGDEKREAIRQLCILVDYERHRFQELKKSFLKVSMKT